MSRNPKQGMNWIRLSTRLAIYDRDGFACVYCRQGAETEGVKLTLDHVLPCAHGGTNSPGNLVTACVSCNSAKGALTLRQWYQALRWKGIDTEPMRRYVRSRTKRPLDRIRGRFLAQARDEKRKNER